MDALDQARRAQLQEMVGKGFNIPQNAQDFLRGSHPIRYPGVDLLAGRSSSIRLPPDWPASRVSAEQSIGDFLPHMRFPGERLEGTAPSIRPGEPGFDERLQTRPVDALDMARRARLQEKIDEVFIGPRQGQGGGLPDPRGQWFRAISPSLQAESFRMQSEPPLSQRGGLGVSGEARSTPRPRQGRWGALREPEPQLFPPELSIDPDYDFARPPRWRPSEIPDGFVARQEAPVAGADELTAFRRNPTHPNLPAIPESEPPPFTTPGGGPPLANQIFPEDEAVSAAGRNPFALARLRAAILGSFRDRNPSVPEETFPGSRFSFIPGNKPGELGDPFGPGFSRALRGMNPTDPRIGLLALLAQAGAAGIRGGRQGGVKGAIEGMALPGAGAAALGLGMKYAPKAARLAGRALPPLMAAELGYQGWNAYPNAPTAVKGALALGGGAAGFFGAPIVAAGEGLADLGQAATGAYQPRTARETENVFGGSSAKGDLTTKAREYLSKAAPGLEHLRDDVAVAASMLKNARGALGGYKDFIENIANPLIRAAFPQYRTSASLASLYAQAYDALTGGQGTHNLAEAGGAGPTKRWATQEVNQPEEVPPLPGSSYSPSSGWGH